MANQPESALLHAVRVCKYWNESNLDSYYWHPVLVQTKMSGTVPRCYLIVSILLSHLFILLVYSSGFDRLCFFLLFSIAAGRYQRKCLCMTKYLLSKMSAGCPTSGFGTIETCENLLGPKKISSHLMPAVPFGSLDGCNNSTSIVSASWCESQLFNVMVICHVWYKWQPWTYLCFCRNVNC